MSLKSNRNSFFSSSLVGACLAVIASIPIAAWTAAFFGDSYNSRVLIYTLLLLWSVIGAVCIFVLTKNTQEANLTFGRIFKWFVSAWIWPILLAARLYSRKL